jgi:hypothetical protein
MTVRSIVVKGFTNTRMGMSYPEGYDVLDDTGDLRPFLHLLEEGQSVTIKIRRNKN